MKQPFRKRGLYTTRNASLEERLRQRTLLRKKTGCFMFTGNRSVGGYGLMLVRGKTRQAHRVAWEVANKQKIPPSMCVLHRCDTPACVNPAHLWLGTPKDNARDRNKKNRHYVEKGTARYNAKLTPAKVRIIRKAKMSQRALALRYGVAQTTIRYAQNRKNWMHIK